MSSPRPAAPASAATASSPLAWWQMLVYALPAGPHAFVIMPLMIVIPSFYAANTAVTAAQVAVIISLGRVFDAVIDPFLGHLSDRTRSRLGPRKPWVLGAAVLCPISIYHLYQPPADAGMVYFTGWSFMLYVATSMFEIGRGAWTAELTRDYGERSRLLMTMSFFNIAGSLSFWLLPILLSSVTGTTAITGQTLSTLSAIYAWVLPLLLLLTLWLIPIGVPQIAEQGLAGWRAIVGSLRACRPLWHFLAAIGCWALAQGTAMAVMYVFMTDHMQMREEFPKLMLAYFIVQLAVIPFWGRVLRRVDRHRVWAVSLAVDAVARLGVLFLPLGPSAFVPAMVMVVVMASFSSPANFIPSALLADVIDYNTLKTRNNLAARFFALNSLAIKIMQALGAGLAFSCLALSGFEIGKPNPPQAHWGLYLAYLGIPVSLLLGAAALAWFFPLSRRTHSTVQRRLDRLAARPG